MKESNYDIIEKIYPIAHQETKSFAGEIEGGHIIVNNGKKWVRKHQLKRVEHLSPGTSQIHRSLLAVIGEFIVRKYFQISAFLKRLKAKIWPKNHVIYGSKKDACIEGWFAFQQKDHAHTPIPHMLIEVWGRKFFGQWRLIAAGRSNEDGKFDLPFDLRAVRGGGIRKLYFEVYHTRRFTYKDGKAIPEHDLFHRIKIPISDLTGMSYDLGMLQLGFWRYRKDTPVPRVMLEDDDGDAMEEYTQGRIETIAEQFIPIELTTQKHLLMIERNQALTIEAIQKDYPVNLTIRMEEMSPGITRSDEWFGMRFMNGMFASTFDKDPNNPDLYWVYYHWKTYDLDTSVYAMPNVSVKFKMHNSGYLLPVEIGFTGKLRKGGRDDEQKTVTPNSPLEEWQAAKKAARVCAGITTEIDKHFAETHVNTEQYAIAASRNIRLNPIGALIFPHLKEVTLINAQADKILINAEGYIPKSTAITEKGLGKRVFDVMGTLDWKNWVPMEPISDKHSYAHVAKLYYGILVDYVDEFVQLNQKEIIEEWHEIFSFSKDLVEHSVPKFLCGYLRKKLSADKEGRVEHSLQNTWYTKDNRMDLSIDRPNFTIREVIDRDIGLTLLEYGFNAPYEGEESDIEHAISPITTNYSYDPSSDDLANLKSVCAYVIFQATFGHFWSNSKQYDDIGEIRYNSLGIRLGNTEKGIFGPEEDDSICPDKIISTQMMWWSNMLSKTGYGFIMKNEENDINPRLQELLEQYADDFAKLDIDIHDIQSRTNI